MASNNRTQPSARRWQVVATQEAVAAGLDPVKLMAGVITRGYPQARWRAWARLRAENPRYSLIGIGRVSGYHWASVIYGLRRQHGESHNQIKRSSRA
jgi:hypothetical protein